MFLSKLSFIFQRNPLWTKELCLRVPTGAIIFFNRSRLAPFHQLLYYLNIEIINHEKNVLYICMTWSYLQKIPKYNQPKVVGGHCHVARGTISNSVIIIKIFSWNFLYCITTTIIITWHGDIGRKRLRLWVVLKYRKQDPWKYFKRTTELGVTNKNTKKAKRVDDVRSRKKSVGAKERVTSRIDQVVKLTEKLFFCSPGSLHVKTKRKNYFYVDDIESCFCLGYFFYLRYTTVRLLVFHLKKSFIWRTGQNSSENLNWKNGIYLRWWLRCENYANSESW